MIRSRVRTVRAAPGTGPEPEKRDVRTTTRGPRRESSLTSPAGGRAPDATDGGAWSVTNRIVRGGMAGHCTGRPVAPPAALPLGVERRELRSGVALARRRARR